MTRENISTWPVKKNDKHDYYKLLHIQYNENIIMPRKKENILLSVEVKESRESSTKCIWEILSQYNPIKRTKC